uniref:Uncharacterized protein n=1 Tax=Anguilla anguilla TaxID=7936 RepID=A0A0E9UQ19_ANGAN
MNIRFLHLIYFINLNCIITFVTLFVCVIPSNYPILYHYC